MFHSVEADSVIHLRRDDNMSIYMLCDKHGLKKLIDSMQGVDEVRAESIELDFDKSILTLKRKSPTVLTPMVIRVGDATQISLEGTKIVWTLSDEDRDYIISRFQQCEKDGYFYPAELIRVQVPKNKKLDYLYAELIPEGGKP